MTADLPSHANHSARHRRGPFSKGVIAIGTIALAVVAFGIALPQLRSTDDAMSIENVELSGPPANITLRTVITSKTGDQRVARVWYTLTALGGKASSYTSTVNEVAIAKGAQETISFDEPSSVAAGVYRLDVWLHQRKRGEFVHADRYQKQITMSGAKFVRREPAQAVTISALEVSSTDDYPAQLRGSFSVDNQGPALKVTPSVGLSPVAGGATVGWTALEAVELPSGPSTVEIDGWAVGPVGEYNPRLSLKGADGVVDDVTLPSETVHVAASPFGSERLRPPVGPIVIESVSAPTSAIDGSVVEVQATLHNVSSKPRVGSVTAYLADKATKKPWLSASSACETTSVALEPEETREATIACVVSGQAAKLVASVWAKTSEGDGPLRHNDGLESKVATQLRASSKIDRRLDISPGPVIVTDVAAPAQQIIGKSSEVAVSVENATAVEQVVEVFWLLGRVGDKEPWKDALAAAKPVRITLAPHEQRSVPVKGTVKGPRGQVALIAGIHTVRSDGSVVHSDVGWLPGDVRLVGS